MHILLIVRAAHRLPAAVDRQGADALELLDQTNRVILVVVQRHETDNALQHLRTERVDVSLPRFCQNTKRICVNAFAVLPVLSKGRSDAGDLPLGVTLVETQTKAGALGSTQECDGFRVAAVDLGTQFCARRKRCRNTRLLCEQQGFFCFGQTGVHLAEDVEIAVVVPQLESGDGMLTIKDVVVTIAVADLGRIGDALIKLSSNALDPVGIEMPLVVAARHFQKLTVDDHFMENVLLGLDFILFAQTIALMKSLSLGITPDNPCPTGEVNRVVKGVTLYPYTLK